MQTSRTLTVGIVGLGFIANLHASALIQLAGRRAIDVRFAVADVDPDAVRRFSYPCIQRSRDFEDVTRNAEVDLVIVSVPNDLHASIVDDAVAHGKYVVCEKPLASRLDDAESMASHVESAGNRGAVAFVFRTWPTVELARQIIRRGDIGEVFGYRGHMLHGHNLDTTAPFTWRLDASRSGGGAVVDIGSHALDIAQTLVADIESVSALSATIVPRRDDPTGATQCIEVDDHTMLGVRFAGGATGQVLVSWMAAGQTTDVAFEVFGTKGSLSFSWRRPEELTIADSCGAPRIMTIGPDDPDGDLRFPVAGLGLGYVDAFASFHKRVLDRLDGVESLGPPSFGEALRCGRVVEAAQRSARSEGAWTAVGGATER